MGSSSTAATRPSPGKKQPGNTRGWIGFVLYFLVASSRARSTARTRRANCDLLSSWSPV